MRRAALLIAIALAACGDNMPPDRSPDLALHDEIYAAPSDDGVLCGAISDDPSFPLDSILDGMDRARAESRVIQLFMHDPGKTVPVAKIAAVIAGARERGLRWVTYRELADGEMTGPGIALAFDDWYVDDWAAQRDLLTGAGARVTFFIALYGEYTPAHRAELAELAADGHDIEYHSTHHEAAPAYVARHGMDAYLADEIDPALAAMRADGYDPVVFAYPAGLRTPELDAVLLQRFRALRATTRQCPHMHE